MNVKPSCAIYARFSDDRKQNARSIDDQLALCRDYAARHGWRVAEIFSDAGISGASVFNRPEYERMLGAAVAGRFAIILCEDLDRLARNLGDQARLFERLGFVGVELHTVADGLVNEMHIGLKGTMNALFLKNLALKVRRGQAGRVRAGLAAGGLTYGYAPVPGKPGARVIDEAQADVVRRIFNEYILGRTPRAIAHELNREGIRAPRKQLWNASTINGLSARGAGILNNALYRGVIVWNKIRMVKNPDNGKRVSRANAPTEWQTVAAPQLAIVTPEIFAAAQAHRAERSKSHPVHARAPRHLLSGLLRCAACGGGMSAFGGDRSGRRRIRCTTAKERGDCPAPHTFYLDTIERTVLDALGAELRAPAVIAEYVRTYHAERAKLAAASNRERAGLERRRNDIERESERVIDAIARGVGDEARLGRRSRELAAEAERIDHLLEQLPSHHRVVALHPAVLARYEGQLANLSQALSRGLAAGDADTLALRELVESVTIRRTSSPTARAVAAGVEIEIAGRLGSLIGEKAFPHGIRHSVSKSGSGGRI
jgi:site-specific DNA recombinase